MVRPCTLLRSWLHNDPCNIRHATLVSQLVPAFVVVGSRDKHWHIVKGLLFSSRLRSVLIGTAPMGAQGIAGPKPNRRTANTKAELTKRQAPKPRTQRSLNSLRLREEQTKDWLSWGVGPFLAVNLGYFGTCGLLLGLVGKRSADRDAIRARRVFIRGHKH